MDSTIVSEQDQRATVRFDASLPVHIDGRPGETHNISAHGIYFECDAQQRPGTLVNFTLEFTLYGQRHRMLCEGKVVRVEENGDRIGVAARLLSPFFANDDEPDGA